MGSAKIEDCGEAVQTIVVGFRYFAYQIQPEFMQFVTVTIPFPVPSSTTKIKKDPCYRY